MSKKSIIYKHESYFNREFQFLKDEGFDFEKRSTAYTHKIILPDTTIIYNDTGKEDKRLLYLINQTRRDGKEFKQFYRNEQTKETRFFDLFKPPSDEVLVKIDIKAAYWEFALKRGIITNKTDRLFKKLYKNEKYDVAKTARLKALGSLATCQKIDTYKNGILQKDLVRINKQETSDIYDEICNGIDDIMQEMNAKIDGCVYYYWDCVFVFKEYEKEVIDFLKEKEFKVKTGQSKLSYLRTGTTGYLFCELDNKQYLTRPEHRIILEKLYDETN